MSGRNVGLVGDNDHDKAGLAQFRDCLLDAWHDHKLIERPRSEKTAVPLDVRVNDTVAVEKDRSPHHFVAFV